MIITPDIWGPYGWKFIHMITAGYPLNPTDEEKNNYLNFFLSLSDVLPCSICGNHFKQNLNIYPLDDEALSSRENLMRWSINMHNQVNIINKKKVYSHEEGIQLIWNNFDSNTEKPVKTINKPKIININNDKKLIDNDDKKLINTDNQTNNYYISILFILFSCYSKLFI